MAPQILHVCLVSFHHRNGPQLDLCVPPFPPIVTVVPKHSRAESNASNKSDVSLAIELPVEWSFLPFSCLPDGAHASNEEFIYFHLPPVADWKEVHGKAYESTVFGLACYRQIPATELLNKTADVTRSTVQKAVVVLASEPFLGSVRTKVGMVTEAFFAQKDFSKMDILQTLYESLVTMIPSSGVIPDSSLFMGISLRDLVYKFRQKTLQIFKLLLLGKRVLFFGQKVERLTNYQYSLVSLLPHLMRNLANVGSNTLNFDTVEPPQSPTRSNSNLSMSDPYKMKIKRFNLPLKIFGEGAIWLPYIPLQQIDVLLSPLTKSFLVGTSNSIFTHHSACHIDVVVNTDTGNMEINDPALNNALSLTPADKRFIEEIVKTVVSTWVEGDSQTDPNMNQQIEFEGSDDDIRSRFEMYLLSLLVSTKAMQEAASPTTAAPVAPAAAKAKPKDLLGEFNTNFIKMWQNSPSFKEWNTSVTAESLKEGSPNGGYPVTPGHPYQGTSAISAVQLSLSSKFSEFSRSFSNNNNTVVAKEVVGKAITDADNALKGVVSAVTDPNSHQKVQASANALFSNVSSWYSQKKKEWGSPANSQGHGAQPLATSEESAMKLDQLDIVDNYELIDSEDVKSPEKEKEKSSEGLSGENTEKVTENDEVVKHKEASMEKVEESKA